MDAATPILPRRLLGLLNLRAQVKIQQRHMGVLALLNCRRQRQARQRRRWWVKPWIEIYIPPYESHEHSYDQTQDRTSAARPIAMAHIQSYDHLITRAILSHYFATLSLIVQQSHINARPIARFNAFASQNGRFRSCDRCATTFSYAIILAAVYDPNLNVSIA